ncbi:hypothetical protein [Streptomyces sp. NBC_00572]|uniref:hypothetical protein n=1 Tax=Streptomyces sp. NBC_00572 TaxID=2903664 RepID=UPI0022551DE8|nr:hypothetical protein [Streptomyces sp. NBC_00572]MCX4984544.1 hypothetical protein [Streptomyces sp. NBC_00572]
MQNEQPQGTHHYVLTLDLPGREMATWTGTVTPGTADTRYDVYVFLRKHVTADRPDFARANVTFFALESNAL